MKELTDNEVGYLRIAYDKGYRYVATDDTGHSYFYQKKPTKYGYSWNKDLHIHMKSLCNFGTKWEDEEPTKIADLLGIDVVDWSEVKPFTPVWIRTSENEKWEKAYFLHYDESNTLTKFKVTFMGQWIKKPKDGFLSTYCRLATQDELDEVMKEL